MVTYSHKIFSNWRAVVLALAILILALASWWISQIPSQAASASDLTSPFLPNNFVRSGATTDQTIQALQLHLREAPKDMYATSQLGLIYLQKARESGDPAYYPKIEEAFQKVLVQNPDDYSSVAGMGTLALARHQFAAARQWGEQAKQLNPDRSYAYGVIADAQIELGQYSQAVKTLQAMVNLRPDMTSYSRISYLRELHGQTSQAVEAMQMAVDAGQPALEATAWTRSQLGNLYFNQGDLDSAEYQYQITLQNYPNYLYALVGLGHIRAAQGKWEDGISYLTKASQIMPVPDVLIALGDVYQASGQKEAAQRQYQLVNAIQKLFAAKGVDLDLEIALFNTDHGLDPVATVVQARQAYARRPSIYGADVLAWALYQAGQYPEAAQYSKLALRLGTQDALKYFHAGMISLKLGQHDQARAELQQALKINPYFSILYSNEARQTLSELDIAPVK